MVREPLTPAQLERERLRAARGAAGMATVAAEAGISVETLRKIETGRIATPAFFTVTALARVLGLSLDDRAGDPTDDPAEHEAAS